MTVSPSFEEFREILSQHPQGNIIPIYKDISADLYTPITAYLKLSQGSSWSFLFESVLGGERIGRYSFIGVNPYKVIKVGQGWDAEGDPLHILEQEFQNLGFIPIPGVNDFTGGGIGYISYDCVRIFEPKTTLSTPHLRDSLHVPDAIFLFCDTIFEFDHLYQNLRVITHVRIQNREKTSLSNAYQKAVQEIEMMITKLNSTDDFLPQQVSIQESFPSVSNVGKEGYESFVHSLKNFIHKGEIIQAVKISQSLTL